MLRILITITLLRKSREQLRSYEKVARVIMKEYEGDFLAVYQVESEEKEYMEEIHLLIFNNLDGFESFRKDERLVFEREKLTDLIERISVKHLKEVDLETYFADSE